MAGHSLGEYSALVAADAIGFADAVRLVQAARSIDAGRGSCRRRCDGRDPRPRRSRSGAMLREAVDGVVSPANINAPGQIVIAGTAAAVDAAIERCSAAGAKRAIKLAVSVPSHCALMMPARPSSSARCWRQTRCRRRQCRSYRTSMRPQAAIRIRFDAIWSRSCRSRFAGRNASKR